jgi:hypothetical protein
LDVGRFVVLRAGGIVRQIGFRRPACRLLPAGRYGPGVAAQLGDDGVQFPPAGERGRATSDTGRAVIAEAARAEDPALADRIAATGDWRSGYVGALRELSELPWTDVAAAGLQAVHARFVHVRDGEERPLAEPLPAAAASLPTTAIHGEGDRVCELEVPFEGDLLRGDGLRRRLEDWVRAGTVEPGCATAVAEVMAHPEWLALEGRRVVLLGAGAEMGPLESLSAWGADVLAVDLPGQAARIATLARAGSGMVRMPGDGADLLTSLPELRTWIGEHDAGPGLVVASHVYADGGTHVRLAVAADALVACFPQAAYAALATPTDCYLVPGDVVGDARRRWERRGVRRILQAPLRAASAGRLLQPAYTRLVRGHGLADGIVRQQGPNYALAKRVQRWRAAQAAADGRRVSLNLAPATATRSVLRNRMLAAAYAGARHFGVTVFSPATTRVLMAALLVRDLHRPQRDEPEEELGRTAAHGGLWRIPYELRSALPLAALAGLPRSLVRRG